MRSLPVLLGAAGLCLLAAAKEKAPREDIPAPASTAASGWFGRATDFRIPAFSDSFPGVDLTVLTPAARERFLQRANTEPCPCGQSGCRMHSLAWCLKVDPGCPVALGQLQALAASLAPPRAPAAPPAAAGNPG